MSPLFRRILRRLREFHRPRRPSTRVYRAYQGWLRHEQASADVPEDGPLITVAMPVYNTSLPLLRAAIESIMAQSYVRWELCVVDDASPSPDVAELLANLAAQDSRIRVHRLPQNGGIAGATNVAIAMAHGAFVALLDHDDVLAPHALARVATEIVRYAEADLIFSDEDQLVDDRRYVPYFKPGWNLDLLLGHNLISHLGVYRKSMLERVGGLREGFDGSQDYDLALRCTFGVTPTTVRHVPSVLYHWRQHKGSFSALRLAICQASARKALKECLGERADVTIHPDLPLWNRVAFRVPQPAPLVSLILPDCAEAPHDPLYADVEACADVADSRGEILVFLAAGLTPVRPGWLRELVGQALRPEIGCAGGRLDGPDGLIRFSGYTLDTAAIALTLAPGSDLRDSGYCGHFLLPRSVSAVSRDCLAVQRTLFLEKGGFNVQAGAFADIDLCLRLAESGLRSVWTPHARFCIKGLPAPIFDPAGAAYMRERWSAHLACDLYLNPNTVIEDGNLRLTHPKT